MPLKGKLRTWDDARGFGFIAPRDGGPELFVHISAFAQDGSRPTVGESLVFEREIGRSGKPQAVRVQREALTGSSGTASPASRAASPAAPPPSSPSASRPRPQHRPEGGPRPATLLAALALCLLAGLGWFGWRAGTGAAPPPSTSQAAPGPTAPVTPSTALAPSPAPAATAFRCDGRTHCSQMSSCAEAKFFLQNCPGTKMDGDGDGVPCEQQWCTHPLAR